MDNVTVITSGTAGIGKCIAKRIIKESGEGDIIIINYGHDDTAASAFLSELEDSDRKKVHLIKADLSDYAQMLMFVDEIRKITSYVDWAVFNTGIGTYIPFEEYDIELWNNVLNTNLTIPAFLARELKPMFRENGNIVFMGSHAGQVPYSSSVVYSVSKAGVMFLARSLVKVFEEKSVCVNAIAPGFIETRWQSGRSDESYDRINRKIAKHRFGKPEEVADLCYSVLTNDYLNGGIFDIHGGYDYF